jgi:predicted DNA-binding ribbon-helix-helix protein
MLAECNNMPRQFANNLASFLRFSPLQYMLLQIHASLLIQQLKHGIKVPLDNLATFMEFTINTATKT